MFVCQRGVRHIRCPRVNLSQHCLHLAAIKPTSETPSIRQTPIGSRKCRRKTVLVCKLVVQVDRSGLVAVSSGTLWLRPLNSNVRLHENTSHIGNVVNDAALPRAAAVATGNRQ